MNGATDRRFADVLTVMSASSAFGLLVSTVRRLAATARSSRTAAAFTRVAADVSSMSISARVRLAGVVCLSFAATYAALASLLPQRAAPARLIVVAIVLLALVLGTCLVGATQTLARAWTARRRRPRVTSTDFADHADS